MPQPERVLARIQSLDERLTRLRTEKNRLIARAPVMRSASATHAARS